MTQRIALVAILLVSCALAQDTPKASAGASQKISQTCFGCMCEAASGCDTTSGCTGDVCGPFRITWAYWADSGKPTLNGEAATAPGAWTRCVNDAFCASKAVQGYMDQYAQDCNGDGVINCDDYVRIHRFGGYGCSGQLDAKYENTYKNCVKKFGL
ncbi:invertebrate-type lysozyme 3-like [Diachasmimorpha longicaudata]|uniref:invertebrate-type lysozyme 3-like n=1 Tax=Diachasmimorpha longicaudata TaxID=58733 RepID=UPI0030B8D671